MISRISFLETSFSEVQLFELPTSHVSIDKAESKSVLPGEFHEIEDVMAVTDPAGSPR